MLAGSGNLSTTPHHTTPHPHPHPHLDRMTPAQDKKSDVRMGKSPQVPLTRPFAQTRPFQNDTLVLYVPTLASELTLCLQNPHVRPGLLDNLDDGIIKKLPSNLHRNVRKEFKIALGRNPLAVDSPIPYLAGLLPAAPAQAHCREIKCLIRDPAIRMNAPLIARIVIGTLHIIFHMPGLGILSEAGVVEGCAGVFHAAEGDAFDVGEEAVFADEPVGFGGGFLEMILFYHDAEDVRDGFVEGAGLIVVGESGSVFGYAVGELSSKNRVSDTFIRFCERENKERREKGWDTDNFTLSRRDNIPRVR